MKLKRAWKRFWTLTRREQGGFTLVELIVVIAILAILAGVGTVGYGAYVKSANENTDKTLASNVVRALEVANNSGAVDFEVAGQYSEGLQIPVGFIVLSHEAFDNGEYAAIIASSNAETEETPLEKAVIAAFGSDYANSLQLQYDSWGAGAYASFYSSAEAMIEQVNTMGTKVLDMLHSPLLSSVYSKGKITVTIPFLGTESVQVISQDYKTSDELVAALAEAVAKLDRSTFIEKWALLSREGSEGFGLSGREFYSAVRGAYSQCFANYVSTANNHSNCSTHATKIAAYGEESGDLITDKFSNKAIKAAASKLINAVTDVTFPLAVCEESFETGSLSKNASDFTCCQECYDLWKNGYYNSDQARADAAAFYDTMVTANTYNAADAEGDDLLTWAKKQAAIFEDLYDELEMYTKGRSTIVLTIYQEDGLLDIQVSPADADSRNE